MRMRGRPGHPAGRSAGSWVLDVLVALVAWLVAVPFLLQGDEDSLLVALPALAVVALPLVLRRVWPVPVFVWVVLAGVAVRPWDTNGLAPVAVLVALFTVASQSTLRVALVCSGLLWLPLMGLAIGFAGRDRWFVALLLSGLIGAALGLGLYAGTRRVYLLGLQERTFQLERERDQQGALAAAAERARVAREMHDIVAHHLTVMVALSDGAVAASARSPEQAVEVMRNVSETGRRALADTRRVLGVLRSDGDETAAGTRQPMPGLGDLDDLITRVREAGLATTLEVRGAPVELPAGLQLTVYRLVQEALTNTLKHGGYSARAAVRLQHLPGELRVEVEDDGAGVHAQIPVGVGGGLVGMQERVQAFGGQLASGPRERAGWCVSARMRLDEVEA